MAVSGLLDYLDHHCRGSDVLEFYDEAGRPDAETAGAFVVLVGMRYGGLLGEELRMSRREHRVFLRRMKKLHPVSSDEKTERIEKK